MGDNGHQKASYPHLVPTQFKPGQTGNPKGSSNRQRLNKVLAEHFEKLVPIKNDDGTMTTMTFAEYAAQYLLKWGFPSRPDPKLLPFHIKCLDKVLERVDPQSNRDLAPIVQVVVQNQRQQEFWTDVVERAGDRRVTPQDVIEQLSGNGKADVDEH